MRQKGSCSLMNLLFREMYFSGGNRRAIKSQSYSLQVNPHFVHLKKRVSDSSADLNCLSHQAAVLFPHSGHFALVVGRPEVCSPSRTTISWSSILALETKLFSSLFIGIMFPHFLHSKFPFLGNIILLHLGQNCINITFCVVYNFIVVKSQFRNGIKLKEIDGIRIRPGFQLSESLCKVTY